MSSMKLIWRRFYVPTVIGFLLVAAFAAAFNIRYASANPTWWNNGWQYRKLITIDHTKVAASLTNFPVLIEITDSDLAAKAQSGGDDIVFTDNLPNKLDHEIEDYSNVTGHLVAWVRVPTLSSTTDTELYMYYGNFAASNQENPTSVWDSNYVMVQHLEETGVQASPPEPWQKYAGNPTLNGSTDGFGSAFYDNDSGIYHYYCSWGSILHYTSPNGKTNWTADPLNPMLTGNNEGVPTAWKENGTWYMLYRYAPSGTYYIGLANSTDGSHWTRYEGNPVINITGVLDPWGIIKVGSTYYLWINDGFGGSGRGAELVTSSDLIHWTADTNAIFSGGRYCVWPFKYGSYYYMLVPYYSAYPYGVVELYRCSSPTFYASQREYLGIVIYNGSAGSWDMYRHDTPCVLTDTIYRDTYAAAGNELWVYYSSTPDSGGKWLEGMCIEQNITYALARFTPQPTTVILDSTVNNNNGLPKGDMNLNVAGRIDGADGFDGNDYIDCGNNASIKGMSTLTVEAWIRPNIVGASGIVSKWGSWTSGSYIMWQSGGGLLSWGVITDTTYKTIAASYALQSGQWYHVLGVYDGSQIRLYINGTSVGTPVALTGNVKSTSDPAYIGRYSTVYTNGILDEVRISNTSRSASWISTEYNNQNSPSTFYNVGSEESQQAKLTIAPSLVEKSIDDIGSTFNLQVKIQDVKDLWGFDFNLTWDSTLLTLTGDEYNTTLDALWGSGSWAVGAHDNTTMGYYKLAAVSLLNGFNSTGSHALATLTFRIEDPHSNLQVQTLIHFGVHKLSDSNYQSIDNVAEDGTYRISGEIPSLNTVPTTKTCREYGETFTIQVNVSNAYNLTDFEFEIYFNTTLLDYSSLTWDAWGAGTVTVDEAGGNITGSTSGGMLNGDYTLITVEFKAAFYRIWKDIPGWVNDQSGKIYIQWANLSYPSGPDLGYVRGGLNQISVGPDVAYTFSPIKGDIDNSGEVDLFDLRTVSALYDQENPTYNLTGDPVIDIFDLVVIGANFGYEYNP